MGTMFSLGSNVTVQTAVPLKDDKDIYIYKHKNYNTVLY